MCVTLADGIIEALQVLQRSKTVPELQILCLIELYSIIKRFHVVRSGDYNIAGTKVNAE